MVYHTSNSRWYKMAKRGGCIERRCRCRSDLTKKRIYSDIEPCRSAGNKCPFPWRSLRQRVAATTPLGQNSTLRPTGYREPTAKVVSQHSSRCQTLSPARDGARPLNFLLASAAWPASHSHQMQLRRLSWGTCHPMRSFP